VSAISDLVEGIIQRRLVDPCLDLILFINPIKDTPDNGNCQDDY
jgi:hypothetical protein